MGTSLMNIPPARWAIMGLRGRRLNAAVRRCTRVNPEQACGGWCTRGCSLRGSLRLRGVDDSDLLPDFAAQIGGELFDVVDGFDHHRVRKMLRIKRCEL